METTTGQTATMSQWRAPAAAVEIDLTRVRAAIPRVAGQVNELIRAIPDMTIPIPGSAWSVGDAAAHLVVVFRAFTDAMEGRLEYWDARYGEGDIRTWARLAEGNARTLREVPHRHDPHALARQLREGVQAFLAATTERSPEYAFRTPWYGQDRTRNASRPEARARPGLLLPTARGTPEDHRPRNYLADVGKKCLFVPAGPSARRGCFQTKSRAMTRRKP